MNWIRNTVAGILRNVALYLTVVAEYIAVTDISIEESKDTVTETIEDTIKDDADADDDSENIVLVSERMRKDTILSSDSGIDYEIPDFPTGKDEETGLDFINLEEVSYHSTEDDAWIVVFDKVYEMTDYLESFSHPGGQDVIVEYLGYDATLAFRGVGHSKPAMKMLEKYCIGILPHDERLNFSSHL